MARTETTSIHCDYDDTPLPDGTPPRRFTIDGATYEIDLCPTHGKRLDDLFNDLVSHSRRAAKDPRSRTARDRAKAASIRARAIAAGEDVGQRGRIPDDVVARYK